MNCSKLFGIGLPKTGTSSMAAALNALGTRCLHNPWDFRQQAFAGQYRFTPSDTWDAIVNFGEHFYPQLDVAYPGSKFILTVRDKEEWLRSVRQSMGDTTGFEPPARRLISWLRPSRWLTEAAIRRGATYRMCNALVRIDIYGCHRFDAERFSYVYDLHERTVRDYFRGREQDLLIVRLAEGNPWTKLCEFLGVQPPDVLFPHVRPKPATSYLPVVP